MAPKSILIKPNSDLTIAMAGNPNSGKSSIFNFLTGSQQHVGNYPGVTVEKKEGIYKFQEKTVHVIDLPGIYSMTSFSQEEVIARHYLVEEKPHVVVNVVDASNLERNLYLTIQLLEMGLNVVVALNMIDEVEKSGTELDVDMMSRRLGCPVVPTIGHLGEGISELKEIVATAAIRGETDAEIQYRGELGQEVKKLENHIKTFNNIPYIPQFAAIKLLESDIEVIARFKKESGSNSLFNQIEKSITRLEDLFGYPPEVLIGDRRYGFASGLIREITLTQPKLNRINLTEKIDNVVTNRLLGLPIFLITMYLIFWITFTVGAPLMNGIEFGFDALKTGITAIWPEGSLLWLRSLIIDGIIGGVGGVVVFLPNIVLLFAGISFLEDTGYMARIAFIMDKIMHKIGLHGRSFIPLIIGFGCTVPGIMATRTIRSERTRLTTILILPLMSCGARLTIYLMIIPAFFPHSWHAPMLWIIYVIGVLLAMIIAKILRNTLFKGEAEPFVMELPPYRMPNTKTVLLHMWQRSWLYLRKAGTIILGISVLLWILLYFPQKENYDVDYKIQMGTQLTQEQIESQRSIEDLNYSFIGKIGHFIEPAMKPMGFDWRIGTAFIGAFAAKEVFVAQMGIVFSIGDIDEDTSTLREKLRKFYSPIVGFCIMLFALIATPCMATVAVTKSETGGWKWALVQWGGLTALGWIVTTIVYQGAVFLLH